MGEKNVQFSKSVLKSSKEIDVKSDFDEFKDVPMDRKENW